MRPAYAVVLVISACGVQVPEDTVPDSGLPPIVDAGQPVTQAKCDVTSCPNGCCQGNVCFAGTLQEQCGHGGAACQSCNAGDYFCSAQTQECTGNYTSVTMEYGYASMVTSCTYHQYNCTETLQLLPSQLRTAYSNYTACTATTASGAVTFNCTNCQTTVTADAACGTPYGYFTYVTCALPAYASNGPCGWTPR